MGAKIARAVIHIGFPKTGTSTLQCHSFAEHSQIEFLGKWSYPAGGWTLLDRRRRIYSNPDLKRLVDHACGPRSSNPDFDLCASIVAEHLKPAIEAGRVPLLSKEGLSIGTPREKRRWARNLREILGADCRILVTLRHPVACIRSRYDQHLKRLNVSPHGLHKPPHFVGYADWLRRESNLADAGPLDTLECYEGAFGHDNLGVFVYEQLLEDPERYYRGIFRFIGVDPDEGWSISQGRRENEGWSEIQIQRLRTICESPWRSTCYRRLPLRLRRRWLGLGAPDGTPRHREQTPDDVIEKIDDRFRGEYRAVMERWSVPLDRYGYPV